MSLREVDIEELLQRIQQGDQAARDELLARHRDRLCRMVGARLDQRICARVDASDVVQEALVEAHMRLPEYLRDRPLPFYPWLRQIAWERLVKLQRQHLHAQKRSVLREREGAIPLPDESVVQLADLLLGKESTPSTRLQRQEMRSRVQTVLTLLAPRDREVLVLRHLEQMSMAEIAAVLNISEGAVKVRHLRALQRFHELLEQPPGGETP
jgi:RNA polymerase sigma-70 factor (ECF subfamily)